MTDPADNTLPENRPVTGEVFVPTVIVPPVDSAPPSDTAHGNPIGADQLTLAEPPRSLDSGSGNISYTPPAGFCGLDSFVYLVNDGQEGGTACGVVTVRAPSA